MCTGDQRRTRTCIGAAASLETKGQRALAALLPLALAPHTALLPLPHPSPLHTPPHALAAAMTYAAERLLSATCHALAESAPTHVVPTSPPAAPGGMLRLPRLTPPTPNCPRLTRTPFQPLPTAYQLNPLTPLSCPSPPRAGSPVPRSHCRTHQCPTLPSAPNGPSPSPST